MSCNSKDICMDYELHFTFFLHMLLQRTQACTYISTYQICISSIPTLVMKTTYSK